MRENEPVATANGPELTIVVPMYNEEENLVRPRGQGRPGHVPRVGVV